MARHKRRRKSILKRRGKRTTWSTRRRGGRRTVRRMIGGSDMSGSSDGGPTEGGTDGEATERITDRSGSTTDGGTDRSGSATDGSGSSVSVASDYGAQPYDDSPIKSQPQSDGGSPDSIPMQGAASPGAASPAAAGAAAAAAVASLKTKNKNTYPSKQRQKKQKPTNLGVATHDDILDMLVILSALKTKLQAQTTTLIQDVITMGQSYHGDDPKEVYVILPSSDLSQQVLRDEYKDFCNSDLSIDGHEKKRTAGASAALNAQLADFPDTVGSRSTMDSSNFTQPGESPGTKTTNRTEALKTTLIHVHADRLAEGANMFRDPGMPTIHEYGVALMTPSTAYGSSHPFKGKINMSTPEGGLYDDDGTIFFYDNGGNIEYQSKGQTVTVHGKGVIIIFIRKLVDSVAVVIYQSESPSEEGNYYVFHGNSNFNASVNGIIKHALLQDNGDGFECEKYSEDDITTRTQSINSARWPEEVPHRDFIPSLEARKSSTGTPNPFVRSFDTLKETLSTNTTRKIRVDQSAKNIGFKLTCLRLAGGLKFIDDASLVIQYTTARRLKMKPADNFRPPVSSILTSHDGGLIGLAIACRAVNINGTPYENNPEDNKAILWKSPAKVLVPSSTATKDFIVISQTKTDLLTEIGRKYTRMLSQYKAVSDLFVKFRVLTKSIESITDNEPPTIAKFKLLTKHQDASGDGQYLNFNVGQRDISLSDNIRDEINGITDSIYRTDHDAVEMLKEIMDKFVEECKYVIDPILNHQPHTYSQTKPYLRDSFKQQDAFYLFINTFLVNVKNMNTLLGQFNNDRKMSASHYQMVSRFQEGKGVKGLKGVMPLTPVISNIENGEEVNIRSRSNKMAPLLKDGEDMLNKLTWEYLGFRSITLKNTATGYVTYIDDAGTRGIDYFEEQAMTVGFLVNDIQQNPSEDKKNELAKILCGHMDNNQRPTVECIHITVEHLTTLIVPEDQLTGQELSEDDVSDDGSDTDMEPLSQEAPVEDDKEMNDIFNAAIASVTESQSQMLSQSQSQSQGASPPGPLPKIKSRGTSSVGVGVLDYSSNDGGASSSMDQGGGKRKTRFKKKGRKTRFKKKKRKSKSKKKKRRTRR